MSSVIGHILTGATIALPKRQPASWGWMAWLLALACFPDIEYLALWFFGSNFPVRLTHSLFVCALLPTATCVWLRRCRPQQEHGPRTIQAFAAGWSHPLLDLLTGVSALPLLWPFSNSAFRLPFGILPSAGQLSLSNGYLYRNLGIELGILAPLCSLLLFQSAIRRHPRRRWIFAGHLVVLLPCLLWGMALQR
ncbi:MAG: metal-dependent hydrolase [Proteobacteria bacterium]|nr:metal-dependent hydrolase [Pseudomonadota bacterium]